MAIGLLLSILMVAQGCMGYLWTLEQRKAFEEHDMKVSKDGLVPETAYKLRALKRLTLIMIFLYVVGNLAYGIVAADAFRDAISNSIRLQCGETGDCEDGGREAITISNIVV